MQADPIWQLHSCHAQDVHQGLTLCPIEPTSPLNISPPRTTHWGAFVQEEQPDVGIRTCVILTYDHCRMLTPCKHCRRPCSPKRESVFRCVPLSQRQAQDLSPLLSDMPQDDDHGPRSNAPCSNPCKVAFGSCTRDIPRTTIMDQSYLPSLGPSLKLSSQARATE